MTVSSANEYSGFRQMVEGMYTEKLTFTVDVGDYKGYLSFRSQLQRAKRKHDFDCLSLGMYEREDIKSLSMVREEASAKDGKYIYSISLIEPVVQPRNWAIISIGGKLPEAEVGTEVGEKDA